MDGMVVVFILAVYRKCTTYDGDLDVESTATPPNVTGWFETRVPGSGQIPSATTGGFLAACLVDAAPEAITN